MSDDQETERISDWTSQVRRGVLEFCILALIAQGPKYGYEIVTQLSETPELAAGEGTVYPLLRRLRKDGWLDTFWQESASGPPRQYYRLKEAGELALQSMRHQWQDLIAAVNHYIVRGVDDHG